MDIIKAFAITDAETIDINIQGTTDAPLFQANQVGRLLGIVNIHNQLSKFSNTYKVLCEQATVDRGVQKTAFVTEAGLYRLLSRSNKPIAEKFQQWMTDVLIEIRRTGEFRLKEQVEIDRKLMEAKIKRDVHTRFLEMYDKKNVVYILDFNVEIDGKTVMKLGSTQNIKERVANISTTYGVVPLIRNIFESPNHTKLEAYMRDKMKSLAHSYPKKSGANSRETYLMTEDNYKTNVQLVRDKMPDFETTCTPRDLELKLEIQKVEAKKSEYEVQLAEKSAITLQLKVQLEALKLERERLVVQRNAVVIPDEPEEEDDEASDDDDDAVHVKKRRHTRSPKILQYDPATLDHIATHESFVTLLRTFDCSVSALKLAIRENAVYKNFRWMLEFNRDATDIPVPPPTARTRQQSVQYIAMMDVKQTKIVEVFASQKEAAQARNLAGFSTISRAIKQGSLSSGHYWNIFDKCSEEMKAAFLSTNTLPERHVHQGGVAIQQIDAHTDAVLKTFASIQEVTVHFQMSRTSLKKASEEGEAHKGFRWKILQ